MALFLSFDPSWESNPLLLQQKEENKSNEKMKKRRVGRFSNVLGLSEITISLRCNIEATKRKMEHIPNIIVIGNALTCGNQSQRNGE